MVKVENSYDGFGRRRVKKVFQLITDNWSLITEIHLIYDGAYIIAETDGSGNILRRYIRNRDQLLAAEDISIGKTFYYFTDGNKNVTDMIDSDGVLAAHYEYDPFGKIVVKSGYYADTNPFRFSSEYFDKETGLVAYLYRFYSPEYCRFLNRDPIGESSHELLKPIEERYSFLSVLEEISNPYRHCHNNPISYTDSMGLFHFYGNWGGPDWTGGLENVQYEDLSPTKQELLSPPIDEMDACFKKHDLCWSKARVKRDKVLNDKCASEGAKKKATTQYEHDIDICDNVLDKQLKKLDKDPTKWSPPAPDPDLARKKRKQAELWF